MNRTYKVIWNKARRCYVVVSELAKSQHKSSCKSEQIAANTRRNGKFGNVAVAAVVAGLLTFGCLACPTVLAKGTPAENKAGTGTGIAIGEDSQTNESVDKDGQIIVIGKNQIAIGVGAKDVTDNTAPNDAAIAIGAGAHTYNELGRRVAAVSFGKDTKDYTGGIAIGTNTYAITTGTSIGQRDYNGEMGDITVSNDNRDVLQYAPGTTSLGSNAYAGGTLATVIGAYNISTSGYNGKGNKDNYNSWKYAVQNFGSTILGTLNTNESATAPIETFGGMPIPNYSGIANSLVGVANRTYNANGAIIMGAGNEVTNSVSDISGVDATKSSSSVNELADTLRKGVRQSNAGGATMVIGGGNKADYTQKTAIIGVKTTVTGTKDQISDYNMINAFNSTISGASHLYNIGYNNNLNNVSNSILFGNNYSGSLSITGLKDSVIIGNSAASGRGYVPFYNVKNVVSLGNGNIMSRTDDAVAIGSNNFMKRDGAESYGYDTGNVAIGNNTYINSYANQGDSIVIGKNATVVNMVGSLEKAFSFGTPAGKDYSGSIAIGQNAYARSGSTMIGVHNYWGKLGDLDINYEKGNEGGEGPAHIAAYQESTNATTVGNNSYNNGVFSTVMGSYTAVSGFYHNEKWGEKPYGMQNFGAAVIGSLNSVEGLSSPDYNTAGMADSILGSANRTRNANGTVMVGAGNVVENSINDFDATGIKTKEGIESPNALSEAMRKSIKDANGGGAATVVGNGNEVKQSTNVSVLGSKNKLKSSKNAQIFADNRTVTDADGAVIIGSADAQTPLTTDKKNVTILGYNANAKVDGGVALGSGSIAETDAGIFGWDPKTNAVSTTDSKVWKSSWAAVSVGDSTHTRQITNVAAGKELTDAVNVAQLKAAQTHYYSVKSDEKGEGSNYANDGAHGTNSMAAGVKAVTWGNNATAVGTSANAWGENSTAIGTETGAGKNASAYGYKASAYGDDATSIGSSSGATTSATAVGARASAYGINGTAVGNNATAGEQATSVGFSLSASGKSGTAVGTNNSAYGENSTVLGASSSAGHNSTAIGYRVSAFLDNPSKTGASVAIGYETSAAGEFATALGPNVSASGQSSTSIGYSSEASGENATAVGKDTTANRKDSTAIGHLANASGESAAAIGLQSTANGVASVAVGFSASASEANGTALGYRANTSGMQATAIGNEANASQGNGVAIGYQSNANNVSAVTIGDNSNSNGKSSVAVGKSSNVAGDESVGLGFSSNVSGDGSTGLGRYTNVSGKSSVAIGDRAKTSGNTAVSIGYNANAAQTGTIAIGNGASASGAGGYVTTNASNAIAIGTNSNAYGNNSIVIGGNDGEQNSLAANNAVAIGTGATAWREDSVVLGMNSNSAADKGVEGYDPSTGLPSMKDSIAWKSTRAAVSFGDSSKGITRQISNVAAGSLETDAVNVAQLKAMRTAITGEDRYVKSGNIDTKSGTLTLDVANSEPVSIKGLTDYQLDTDSSKTKYDAATHTLTLNMKDTLNTSNKEKSISFDGIAGTADVAKATTEVEGDKNFYITPSTAGDGHTIYTLGLANTVKIGSGESAKTITIDGTKGEVSGLSNTTWNKNIDYSKSNKAATEAQLQQAMTDAKDAAKSYDTDTHIQKGTYAVGDNHQVSMDIVDKDGKATGDKVTITDVAKASDVGDISKLSKEVQNEKSSTTVVDAINNVNTKVNTVDSKIGDLKYSSTNYVKSGDNVTDSISNLDKAIHDATTEAGKHSTVSEGKNIKVTPTTTDGKTDYNVGLDDDIDLNSVTAKSVTTANLTVKESATIGNVTINKDGKGTIGGLTNTAWDANKITLGQAATEDQLKDATKNAVNYDDDDSKTITLREDTTIKNVADTSIEQGSKNAVNAGTVYNETRVAKDGTFVKRANTAGENLSALDNQVTANTESIYHINNRVSDLDNRVNKVGAGAAALAALHPLDFDPDDKWDFAVGYGNYRNANSVAFGAFYRPNEDTMFSLGTNFGNGENMFNAGLSFKIGQGSGITTSKTAMAKKIESLEDTVDKQDKKIAELEALVKEQGEMIRQYVGKK